MATLERNNKILLDLVRQPGNNMCADCGAPGEYTESQNFSCRSSLSMYIYVLFI